MQSHRLVVVVGNMPDMGTDGASFDMCAVPGYNQITEG